MNINVHVHGTLHFKMMDIRVMLVCISNFNNKFFISCSLFFQALIPPRENVLQCHCLHGKCVFHVDEQTGRQSAACECLSGYKGENCDQRKWSFPPVKHLIRYIIIAVAGLLLAVLLALGLFQIKRKGGFVKFKFVLFF